jgi:hypothetical protein
MVDQDHAEWLRDEEERKLLRVQVHAPLKKPVPAEDDKKREDAKDDDDDDDDEPDSDEELEETESEEDKQ